MRHQVNAAIAKDPASRKEQGQSWLCEPNSYLSSKAKMSTGVVDRACYGFNRTYRCGTALDFDQLPLLGPVTGAPAVFDSL